jgi:hypothetical protein
MTRSSLPFPNAVKPCPVPAEQGEQFAWALRLSPLIADGGVRTTAVVLPCAEINYNPLTAQMWSAAGAGTAVVSRSSGGSGYERQRNGRRFRLFGRGGSHAGRS